MYALATCYELGGTPSKPSLATLMYVHLHKAYIAIQYIYHLCNHFCCVIIPYSMQEFITRRNVCESYNFALRKTFVILIIVSTTGNTFLEDIWIQKCVIALIFVSVFKIQN